MPNEPHAFQERAKGALLTNEQLRQVQSSQQRLAQSHKVTLELPLAGENQHIGGLQVQPSRGKDIMDRKALQPNAK